MPAPKPIIGIIYEVRKDPDGRWMVARGDEPIGAFPRRSAAVGQACRAARQEAATTDLKVIVYVVENGKRTKEWEGSAIF